MPEDDVAVPEDDVVAPEADVAAPEDNVAVPEDEGMPPLDAEENAHPPQDGDEGMAVFVPNEEALGIPPQAPQQAPLPMPAQDAQAYGADLMHHGLRTIGLPIVDHARVEGHRSSDGVHDILGEMTSARGDEIREAMASLAAELSPRNGGLDNRNDVDLLELLYQG